MFEVDNPDAHCQSKVVVYMIILRANYTFPSISPIHVCTSPEVIAHVVQFYRTLRWSSLSAMCIGAVFPSIT